MIDSYIVVDVETTGLDPKKDKIIEIGAVKVCKGVVEKTYSKLINPGRALSSQVMQLTGISNENLMNEPDISSVIRDFIDFAGTDDLPIMGHSLMFDYAFLKRAAVNHKLQFEKRGIDTLKIARKYLPELESRNLNFLCRYYGIEHKAHRALADAYATHEVFQRLQTILLDKEDEDKLFYPVQLQYQVKKEGPASKRQKERIRQLLEQHDLIPDYDIELLTKNEASRYTDQILATYGR